jgi:hypothetical protein
MSTVHISETKADAAYWYRQFQLQQNMKGGLQAQVTMLEADLEELRHVLAEARALHHESKFMETVSYCDLCTERWPCESVLVLTGSDNASSETVNEGATASE